VRHRAVPDHGFVSPSDFARRQKIIPIAPSALDSQAKAQLAARAALDKQAEDVVVIDLRQLSSVADFFVICTAGSARQTDAILQHVEAALAELRSSVLHTEGANRPVGPPRSSNQETQWVLLDCGDLVVHIFDRTTREFYRLEDLWADAPRVPVPG